MPETPLPRNGKCALLHGSRAGYSGDVSDDVALFHGYSKMIRGGLIGPEGGRGLPQTSPPWGRGGQCRIFPEGWGGPCYTPLL